VSDRVYRAVACQRVDQIHYNIFLYELGPYEEMRISVVFILHNCLPADVCLIKVLGCAFVSLLRRHKVGFLCVLLIGLIAFCICDHKVTPDPAFRTFRTIYTQHRRLKMRLVISQEI
jgi:hypothetical protein